MTRWTTKEILHVSAGREHQNQRDDDPVKHGSATHRFDFPRHQRTSPANIEHKRRLNNSLTVKYSKSRSSAPILATRRHLARIMREGWRM
jgi:hypothetical protein